MTAPTTGAAAFAAAGAFFAVFHAAPGAAFAAAPAAAGRAFAPATARPGASRTPAPTARAAFPTRCPAVGGGVGGPSSSRGPDPLVTPTRAAPAADGSPPVSGFGPPIPRRDDVADVEDGDAPAAAAPAWTGVSPPPGPPQPLRPGPLFPPPPLPPPPDAELPPRCESRCSRVTAPGCATPGFDTADA